MNRESKYKRVKRSSQRIAGQRAAAGFTLIELLIVIVVIAILASIAVVSYRGVQTRAVTTSYIAAASQAEKVIKLAKTAGSLDFKSLPHDDDDGVLLSCIGTEDDFPADGDFGAGECVSDDSHSSAVSVSSHLIEALQEVSPGFKTSKLQVVKSPSSELLFRGIVLRAYYAGDDAALLWLPPDGKSCGPGTLEGGEHCELILFGTQMSSSFD